MTTTQTAATKRTRKPAAMKIADAAKLMGVSAKAAAGRLKALGYTVTCTRCLGSGRYSYNQMDGDRCWGCDGRKVSLAPLSIELVTEAMARIAAGELDGYFATNRARTSIKAKAEEFWAVFMACPIGKEYTAASIADVGVLHTPVGRAWSLCCAAHEWVKEAQYGRIAGTLDCGRKATDLDPVTAVANIDAAIAVVRAVERAWASR